MFRRIEKEFLIIGVLVGSFSALFYDLFQNLLSSSPDANTAWIKILSCFLTIIVILVFLSRYFKSIKKDEKCKNSQTPEITNDDNSDKINLKKRLGKFVQSEMWNLFILLGASGALTISVSFPDFLSKFISGLIASGLFIIGIFRRARSNDRMQSQIDGLRHDIDELKRKSANDDNTRSDNQ